jgi:hypothetical protein
VLNHPLMVLSVCLADEIMTSPRIKQDDSRMPVQRKRTREYLLTLGNVFHSGVVDVVGLYNGHLMLTTWWIVYIALCGILLWRGALLNEVARATTVEAGVVGGGPSSRWCR